MSQHTKEPWRVRLTNNAVYYIFRHTGNGDEEEVIEYFTHDKPGQDSRRIVACVNACVGVPTEALEKAAECAEHGVIPTLAAQYKADADALLFAAERAYETLIQERNNVPFKSRPYSTEETITILRKSIAKARGIS